MTELRQVLSLKQTLQLVMTPQLQQAIKLLQLSRMELNDLVNQEMLENPVLDETTDGQDGGEAKDASERIAEQAERLAERIERSERVEEVKGAEGANDIDWEKYLENYGSYIPVGSGVRHSKDDMPSYENVLTKKTSLADHLLWQLRLSELDEQEQNIGAQIILSLNPAGYFYADDADKLAGKTAVESLAESMDVGIEDVERVLKVMHTFDPVGVAARDLRESLLVQARHLRVGNGLVYAIIDSHLPHVERKNYQAIARALKVPKEEIYEAVKLIGQLEPKPGRFFTEEEPQYITPDIYVQRVADEYVIVLNEDGMAKLRVSPYYRKALAEAKRGGETRSYIQDKLRSAVWLIRSIHQRQRTIYRVTESIVKFQREFFDKGIAFLRPLVLRDVADDVGLHESTVSRVTTNKYVHTPQGIYELKYFFNSAISRTVGEDLASESVKAKIRQIVADENQAKPLSDRKIVDMLKEQNIDIARRTVAKYREMLGILPSSKRKQVF
ncbi:MAG: RNA polymerase factor sigma-54 [Deltaproteobacteria bacterium]|nr:RNA polymerase factor sigma-54 [Deltaproteobacteria bacterium]